MILHHSFYTHIFLQPTYTGNAGYCNFFLRDTWMSIVQAGFSANEHTTFLL